MDEKFTESIKSFLDSPTESKDWAEGAMLLYRLRANPVEFRKLSRNPAAYGQYITAELLKFYRFRTSGTTHATVIQKVDKAQKVATQAAVDEKRSGRRPDHDSLPEEIRKLYEENLPIYRKIADYQAKIRLILESNANCKDADLLPFASEIVKLDKKRLANWKKYDEYSPS